MEKNEQQYFDVINKLIFEIPQNYAQGNRKLICENGTYIEFDQSGIYIIIKYNGANENEESVKFISYNLINRFEMHILVTHAEIYLGTTINENFKLTVNDIHNSKNSAFFKTKDLFSYVSKKISRL